MGIGREVADAYIDVHGDLSSFRRDLNDLSGAEAAAIKNADKFTKAWADRIESDVNGKWSSIVDAMYSDKKIDWDQLIGAFDGRSLEDANGKITEFMDKMRAAGKLTTKQYEDAKKAIDGQIDSLREQNKLLDRQEQEQRGLGLAADANAKLFAEANRENERWARTWEGMRKNNAIADMEGDFRKLAAAMDFTDMEKFAKSFDSLIKARSRIYDVTAAMQEQGRISRERAEELQNHFNAFIDSEKAKSKAMKDALDETNRLKAAQDKYNQSLSGMARAFHFSDLEAKFKQLAVALDSSDWSGMARGAKDMDELRKRTMETATEMHRLGRMTDQELKMVGDRINAVSKNMRAYNVEFKEARDNAAGFGTTMRNVLTRTGNLFTRLNNVTRGFREHLQGFAGLNVFGDMIQKGLDFVRNLDRIAVSLGKNTILMSSMAAVGASAFAGLVTVAADLGEVIGGLAVVLPAFAVGAAIGIGVLVAAMKDMETVLADLKPAFAELQNQISSSFWTAAAGPIREMVKTLMPILTPKLKGTAAALGGLVGKLAKAFKDIPADALNVMFDRMNKSIDILGNAMPPLVRAFTTLGMVGSKYFERFSTWMVKLTDQFDAFIQRSAANGDLDKWINNMIEGFKNIGRAIDGAMGIFNALNTAAERAGFGGLKTFADALQRAAAIMQTPEFQTTLTTYLDGARDLALKLGKAIYDLGPAFESFAPTANIALNNIGDAVQRLIGYVGEIFSNPTFQKGVEDFTGSLATAVEKLQPAIKPFADSLGQALSLLGQITVAVAEVATAFIVHLSPVLDSMSAKFSTLIDPLKNTVINFIKEMEGPLKALDEQFIGPLVAAFNEKLLPEINKFVDKFGPFAEKVIKDLGPAFTILVDTVLPNFVRLAGELLTPLGGIIDLLSETTATTLEKIGTAFGNLADSIKVLKGELPITELFIFKAMDPEKIRADAEAAKKEVADNMSGRGGTSDWGQVIADIFWGGVTPDVFWSRVYSLVGPNDKNNAEFAKSMNTLGTFFEGIRQKVVDDWNRIWSGELDREFTNILIAAFPGQADFLNGIQGWTDDVFSGKWFGEVWTNISKMWADFCQNGTPLRALQEGFGTWWKTSVSGPIGKAFNEFVKSIPESFTSDVSEWGLLPAIVNFFTNFIAPEIKKAFTEGWKKITDGSLLKGAQEESGRRWDGFWKEWNNFWGGFGSMSSDIQKWWEGWWNTNVHEPFHKAVTDAWKGLFEKKPDSGGGGGGGQKSWWDSMWKFIGEMFTGGGDVGNWRATVNTFLEENIWTPLREWFEDLDWADIGKNLWDGFIAAVTGGSTKQWEKMVQGFTGWVEDIREFFGIKSPSTLMFALAMDIVQGFLNGFGEFAALVGEKWEEIKITLATKWTEITTAINLWIEERKKDWVAFWTRFGEIIGEKWEEFKTTLATKWTEVTTGINKWIEERKADWEAFWRRFGEIIGEKWEEFKTTLATKWTEVTDGFNKWFEARKADWNGFWSWLVNLVPQKWEEIKTWIRNKIEDVRAGLVAKYEEIKRNWEGFWNEVINFLPRKWEEIRRGVETGIQAVVTWFQTLPGRVSAALSGFSLWANGWNILSGLWQGMLSMWGNITKWVGSIAAWIAENKGPLSYDLKLLEPAGKAIMTGLRNGMQGQMDPLLNTLQTITAAVTDTVTADLSKSVMYATGKDAAQGLADGLKANRTSVHTALGNLGAFTVPSSQITVGGAFAGSAVGRPTADVGPSRSLIIAEGAIKIETPTKSPELVAAKVIDSFVHYSTF